MENQAQVIEDKTDREKLILNIKVTGLKAVDPEKKPSSYIILAEKFDNVITEIGRTEVQEWKDDPEYEQKFVVDFVFERKQRLKAQIVFVDSFRKRPLKEGMVSKLSNKEGVKIGYVDFYLHTLFNNKKFNYDFEITANKKDTEVPGTVNVRLEKYNAFPYKFSFTPKGKNMTNFGIISSITPTIYFLKPVLTPNQRNEIMCGKSSFKDMKFTKWRKVAERNGQGTEFVFQRVESDSWKFLSCGSLDSPICLQLYNRKKEGMKLKGQKTVTFLDIAQDEGNYFQLICPKRKKSAGTLIVNDFEFQRIYSFSEFMQSGLDISAACYLDFTQANLEKTDKNSLHYINPDPESKVKNPYQKMVRAICTSLLHYDGDGQIHGFGFGATVEGEEEVNHHFPLRLQAGESTASGHEDFWKIYEETLNRIQFAETCQLALTIKEMINFAADNAEQGINYYTVAIILTTGNHSDQQELINQVVKASFFPISVLFVGIGESDFKNMEVFNSTFKSSEGTLVGRRSTKFVRFSDFKGKKGSELTASLMGGLPEQIVGYYKMIGQKPSNPDEVDGLWNSGLKIKEAEEDKEFIKKQKQLKADNEAAREEKPVEVQEEVIEEKVQETQEPEAQEPEAQEPEVQEAQTQEKKEEPEQPVEEETFEEEEIEVLPDAEEGEPIIKPEQLAPKVDVLKETDKVAVGNDSDYEEVEIEVEVTDSEGEDEYEYVEVEVEVTDSEAEEEEEVEKE